MNQRGKLNPGDLPGDKRAQLIVRYAGEGTPKCGNATTCIFAGDKTFGRKRPVEQLHSSDPPRVHAFNDFYNKAERIPP